MDRFFFIKDSSKSLTPLFSSSMVSSVFYSICIASCFLVGFWPQSPVFRYFQRGDLPVNSLVVFSAVLIMLSFIAIRSGSGEMTHHDSASTLNFKQVSLELQYPFLTYGFIRFLIQNLLLFLPFIPIFVLSITLSGVSIPEFIKLLLILYNTTLICRLVSFQLYLHFGKNRFRGFFFNLFFLVGYFIISYFLYAPLNPLAQVYGLSVLWSLGGPFFSPWEFYMVVTSVTVVFLAVFNHIIVAFKRPENIL